MACWGGGPVKAEKAAEDPTGAKSPLLKSGWSSFFQGGALHQFDADMDDDSRFSVNRYFLQAGMTYAANSGSSVSVAVGYGQDHYDFSGNGGFSLLSPWKTVHSLRLSAPIRWGLDRNWVIYFVPTLRTAAESGADWGDAMFGGGFAGFTYRFSDRLTIGPGIGAIRQIEDSSIFPVLLIDWNITDEIALQTGRGLGATLGPGLLISWTPTPKWSFGISGRYEKLRFRLDKEGMVPRGIGDDRAFPVLAGVTYRFSRDAQVRFSGGVDLGGRLRLEDEGGGLVLEEDHDAVPVIAASFRFRF
jgi:hypothetical protein